jgi:hypothetical protein
MKGACLNIARCALAAWVGAAAIFVVTAVHEVRSPVFTSQEKSALALLRFPTYYQFGFTLVSLSLVAGGVAIIRNALGKGRGAMFLVVVIAALALMAFDYYSIYGPLAEMLTAEETGTARPEHFQKLHAMSKNVNTIDVSLCFAAMILLCWPQRRVQD